MLLFRYISGQILVWTVLAASALIGIVWLSQAIGLIEVLVNRGVTIADFAFLSVLAIPLWLTIVLPMAVLVGTMLTLNRLQQDREITTLNSVGMSNLAIMRAPIIVGVFASFFLYVNSAVIMPVSYSGLKDLQDDLRRSAPIVVLQEGIFIDITKGLTIFIGEKVGTYSFKNIFVRDSRDAGKTVEVTADSGFLSLEGGNPQLVFSGGTRSELLHGDGQQGQAALLHFDRYSLSLGVSPHETGPRAVDYNELGIATLLEGAHDNPKYAREMRAEGHFRLASPLLALAMAVIGAASILGRRYSRLANWRMILVGSAAAGVTQIALIIAHAQTVELPGLYPLLYIIPSLAIALSICLMVTPDEV